MFSLTSSTLSLTFYLNLNINLGQVNLNLLTTPSTPSTNMLLTYGTAGITSLALNCPLPPVWMVPYQNDQAKVIGHIFIPCLLLVRLLLGYPRYLWNFPEADSFWKAWVMKAKDQLRFKILGRGIFSAQLIDSPEHGCLPISICFFFLNKLFSKTCGLCVTEVKLCLNWI